MLHIYSMYDLSNLPVTIDMIDDDWKTSLSGGISITLGPLETHQPPSQPDLFRHYITSQWMHSSHLADEDPQWQCEAWIKSKPHLAEAWHQQCLEIKHVSDDTVEYYYIGSEQDHFTWRLRWSEMFDSNA